MSRRAVLVAAGLAAPFLPRLARAAEVTWRIGHSAPVDFPMHLRLVEAAGTIASRSEGQMAVEIHPNSELGGPLGLLAQARAGTIDAVPLTGQVLARDLPIAALPMVGFAFTGPEQMWPALDGGVGGYIRAQIKELLGLVAMDRCWDFGFHQITTSGKVIKSAEDMAGLRLRTPPEADYISLLQALKALPVTAPLNVLETALRTHAIDGQESVLPLIEADGLFRVQSVCALTNHVWDGEWICVSGKSWTKLPAKLRDIVAAALNESGLHQRQDMADANIKIRKDGEAAGMKFNAVDTQSFRSVLRKSGYYAAWQNRIGDNGWAALEKYAGQLA
jgi:TRAP-type C4-dicarboxylate transport system substrate-binding protein